MINVNKVFKKKLKVYEIVIILNKIKINKKTVFIVS